MKKPKIFCSLAAVGLLITGVALHAGGPLTPPPGPVKSNFKTLTEVEPRIAVDATNTPGDTTSLFVISQPGSYYLTGNITGVAGKYGIWIQAGGVILDLNGFTLTGVPGSLDGVIGPNFNIAVINGSVRNWGGDGVGLASFNSYNHRVERVFASNNGADGINVGYSSTISNCSAFNNGGGGHQNR